MKFVIILAVFGAVATAEHAVPQNDRILSIIGAIINHLRPPISVGPAIVEDSPISVGPAIVEDSPISVGPAIIDESINVGEVKPTPASPYPVIPDLSSLSSPLIQLIVNVNSDSASSNPVIVQGPKPSPSEIKPTPVVVVEQLEPVPEQVIIAPIEAAPVVVLPDILN